MLSSHDVISTIIFFTSAKGIPAILLFYLGFLDCEHRFTAVILFVFIIVLTGPYYAGWCANFLDIAPAYAGLICGITNAFGSLMGIISTLVGGNLIADVCIYFLGKCAL